MLRSGPCPSPPGSSASASPQTASGAACACAGSPAAAPRASPRSEEHTSELQSQFHLVCRLLLEKKNKITIKIDEEMQRNPNNRCSRVLCRFAPMHNDPFAL